MTMLQRDIKKLLFGTNILCGQTRQQSYERP